MVGAVRADLHDLAAEGSGQRAVFALGVKAVFLLLGALGIANMWVAVFGDVGVMLLAVLNALRVFRYKRKNA